MSGVNVEEGNTLLIPIYTGQAKTVELHWSQDYKPQKANYYCVLAGNRSKQNRQVLVYVQDTYYRDETNNNYIGKIPGVRKDETSKYWDVIITDRFQYGQKSRQGEGRWLVYHDQGRDMYQHRFCVNSFAGSFAEFLDKVSDNSILEDIFSGVKALTGDYLHKF